MARLPSRVAGHHRRGELGVNLAGTLAGTRAEHGPASFVAGLETVGNRLPGVAIAAGHADIQVAGDQVAATVTVDFVVTGT